MARENPEQRKELTHSLPGANPIIDSYIERQRCNNLQRRESPLENNNIFVYFDTLPL
jgi:hypothetical protein